MTRSPDLWDITEVANYFGTSESTIRRKVKKRRERGYGFVALTCPIANGRFLCQLHGASDFFVVFLGIREQK